MEVSGVSQNIRTNDAEKMSGGSFIEVSEPVEISVASIRNNAASIRTIRHRFIISLDRPYLGRPNATEGGLYLFKTLELPGTVSPSTAVGKEYFAKTTHDLALSGITQHSSLRIHGYDYTVSADGMPQTQVITEYGATLITNE